MNKKAFTLIELLAVIAIISILAVITAPTIINVIQTSKEKAFIDTAHSLVEAAGTYQAQKQSANEETTLYINYATSSSAEKEKLKTKGTLPDAGELQIDENGKVTLALWSNSAKICVVKKAGEKEIRTLESIKTSSNCTISNIN